MKNKHYTLVISFFLCIGIYAQNFSVNTATYLGGSSAGDEINACDVAPDGTIVIGGRMPGFNPGGKTPVNLLGGGNGVVIRLNSTGTTVLSITRIGDTIQDLEVGNDGKIAVTGTFGVGLLNSDASAFIWSCDTIKKGTVWGHTGQYYTEYAAATTNKRYRRSVSRVSIGSDGTVATLQVPIWCWYVKPKNPMWYCYVISPTGALLKRITGGGYYVKDTCGDTKFVVNGYAEDVAVDGTNKRVIIGGWNPDKGTKNGYVPIHIPFMYAYDYNGVLKWKDYQFDADKCFAIPAYADSRINEIVIGDDGYLYTAGYIHGGDHLFVRNPKDVTKASGTHVGYDNYSNATNMGAGIDQAYFCKFDPTNGDILRGQALLVRKQTNGTDKPNQSVIKGIDVDAQGNVYMAGYCQLYIPNRAGQQINGTSVGTPSTTSPLVSGSEIFLAIIPKDWNSRTVWTVFSGSGAEGTAWGCGFKNGIGALAGEVFKTNMITTTNALQKNASTLNDGYVVSWGTWTGVKETIKPDYTETFAILTPNPVTEGILNVNSPDADKSFYIIYDMIGKIVQKGQVSSNKINLSNLKTGIYIIKVQLKNRMITDRILVK